MNDAELLQKFKDGTLPATEFNHGNHVKMAWLYLKKLSLPQALQEFSQDLRHFAAVHGAKGLYHETITWTYLIVINERLEKGGREKTWTEFVAENADLFDWKNNILKKFYYEETLKSETARRIFVFPDKLNL